MKKLLLLLCIPFIISLMSCDKDKGEHHHGNKSGGNITNVHAPTSGSDSIIFTADSGSLRLLLFSPLGGSNHVIIHDVTTSTDLYNGDISNVDHLIAGFIPGDNYTIMCYAGTGGSTTNFTHVSSSFRNSGQTPSPFCGYTQYFNSSSVFGPNDGVVIIVLEQPETGSGK